MTDLITIVLVNHSRALPGLLDTDKAGNLYSGWSTTAYFDFSFQVLSKLRTKYDYFVGYAQTLPNAIPPTDKVHQFSKVAVTFNQWLNVHILQDLEFPKPVQHSPFFYWITVWASRTVKSGEKKESLTDWLTDWLTDYRKYYKKISI